jgi:hypothetical protein
MNDRDLLDETTLRRALRFESDEPRPRFDARALAAAARQTVPTRRVMFVALASSLITGLVAATVWSTALDEAPRAADQVVSVVIAGFVSVATVLVPIAQIAADPAVPLSLLAALGVAIAYELRERRERVHAHAS